MFFNFSTFPAPHHRNIKWPSLQNLHLVCFGFHVTSADIFRVGPSSTSTYHRIDRHLLLQRIKIYGDPGFVDMTARMIRTLISFAAIAWLHHTAYSRPNLVPGVLSRPPPIFFLKEDERGRWEQGCSCHSLLNGNKQKVFRRILRHSS